MSVATFSEWGTEVLSSIAEIERSAVPPEQIESGTTYVGLENIVSGGEFVGVGTVENGELASTKFNFTPQHVLYGKLRPYLAKIACPSFSGVCSTDILPILPGPKLDRRFLCYFLRQPHMVDFANSRCSGANLPRLSPQQLAQFEIPLPFPDEPKRSLSEQRRIADILDKADEIRRKRKEAVGLVESAVPSAFEDIFGTLESMDTRYGSVRLGDAEITIADGNYSSKYPKSGDFLEAGVPFIRANNLKDGTITSNDMRFISTEQHYELKKGHLQTNDLLLVTRGSIGQVGLVPQKFHGANINAQLVLLRPRSNQFTSEFLLGYFSAPSVRREILKMQTGTALQQLPVGKLIQLPLPLVSQADQQRFTKVFEAKQSLISRTNDAVKESESLFDSLVQRAFKGEL